MQFNNRLIGNKSWSLNALHPVLCPWTLKECIGLQLLVVHHTNISKRYH